MTTLVTPTKPAPKPNFANILQKQASGFDVPAEAPKEELDKQAPVDSKPISTEWSANPWDVVVTNNSTATEQKVVKNFPSKGEFSFNNFDYITPEKKPEAINLRIESIKANFASESKPAFSTAILMGKAGGTAEKTIAATAKGLEVVGKTAVDITSGAVEVLQIISGLGLKKESTQTPEQKAKEAQKKANIQLNIQRQQEDRARLETSKREESIKEDLRLGIPTEGKVTSKSDKMYLLMKKASQAAKSVAKKIAMPSSAKTGTGARNDGKRFNETSGGAGTVYSAGQ